MTLVATAVLIALVAKRPRAAIVLTFVVLALLGDVRRLVGMAGGDGGFRIDPLLLVGPLAAAALLISIARQPSRLVPQSLLSKLVTTLAGLMIVQIFNPVQGGLTVGLFGVLFFLVPLSWFWIGRHFADQQFVRDVLLMTVVPLAALATLVSIYQAFVGFPPHQQWWIDHRGYNALMVAADKVRPFSFFPSSAESSKFIGVAAVTLAAHVILRPAGRWSFVLAALAGVFFFAVLIHATRTVLAMTAVACCLMWAVRSRSPAAWGPRLAVAVVVGGGVMVAALTFIEKADVPDAIAPMAKHQAAGLLDPFGSKASTVDVHSEKLAGGMLSGLTQPLGHGLGATTLAAARFGGNYKPSEVDVSDIMITLGLPGGLLYVTIMLTVGVVAVTRWTRRRTAASLAVAGVLFAEAGTWLFGGHYALSALNWFLIGSLDHRPPAASHVTAGGGR